RCFWRRVLGSGYPGRRGVGGDTGPLTVARGKSSPASLTTLPAAPRNGAARGGGFTFAGRSWNLFEVVTGNLAWYNRGASGRGAGRPAQALSLPGCFCLVVWKYLQAYT